MKFNAITLLVDVHVPDAVYIAKQTSTVEQNMILVLTDYS